MIKIYVVKVQGNLVLNTASYTPEIARMKWEESTYFNPTLPTTIVTFEQTTNDKTVSKEKRCTTNM